MSAEETTLTPAAEGVRLVLARHGQTPSNVTHVLDTMPPGPELTEEGHRQAAQLADRLASEDLVSIYASQAVRAQQTAAPLAARHGLDVVVIDGVHEVFVGDLEGLGGAGPRRRFEDVYARWLLGELDEMMPGGESGRQALSRFLDGAKQTVDGVTAGTVVVVSHGAMIRLVAGHLAANVPGSTADQAYLPNTGTITLVSDFAAPSGWRCRQWDGLRLG